MRLALLIAALLLPATAHADPISVFAAVLASTGSAAFAGGVAAVTSFLAANAFAVGLVAVNVFGAAAGRRKARKASARQRAEYNASLQDRSVTALSANPPWRIIYGRCITGGDIVAIFTSDKTGTRPNGSSYTKPDALKHLVVVVAAHQVQAINEVYIDGVALGALDGSGWVTTGEFFDPGRPSPRVVQIAAGASFNAGQAVTLQNSYITNSGGIDAEYIDAPVTLSSGNTVINNIQASTVTVNYSVAVSTAKVRLSKHLGTDSQTVDSYLSGVVPTQWDSTCRLRGLAYVVITLDLEEARFQGGPPNFTFDVSGRLAYDPRTATTAWTQNPAVLVRDFLRSPWGYACASTDIDTTLHNAAANACDVAISLDVGGVVTTGQPTYTCNGSFSTADSREAILEDLCESMAGFASYGATWGIVAGAWTAPVMTLADDDLDGQIEVVQAGAGLDTLFNGLRGQYIAAGKATPSDFDSYSNAAFVTADGQELWSDIALAFTNNKARARNLARVFVERNRDGLVIRYPAKLRAWPLQIGDRVTVTSTEYGFSGKLFRLTDWQFGATTAVQLTLQEDAAAVYDLADAATADPAPNTALPNPWQVGALSGVTATSGASTVLKSGNSALVPRVLVSWSAVSDAYVVDGGRIEVMWRRPGGPRRLITEPGDATSTYIIGVDNGDPIVIEVRARNSLGAVGPSTIAGVWVGSSAALIKTPALGDGSVNHDKLSVGVASDLASALSTAAAAQATADGKIDSFWQTTAPGSASEGDLWFDTDDGNKQYRRTSGVWVAASDTRIGAAITAAADAQATADGKVVTFIQGTTPSAEGVGDLWIDTSNGNLLRRWSGASWVQAKVGTNAIEAGALTQPIRTPIVSATLYNGAAVDSFIDQYVNGGPITTLADSRILASVTGGAIMTLNTTSARWGNLVVKMQLVRTSDSTVMDESGQLAVNGYFLPFTGLGTSVLQSPVGLTVPFDSVAAGTYRVRAKISGYVSDAAGYTANLTNAVFHAEIGAIELRR